MKKTNYVDWTEIILYQIWAALLYGRWRLQWTWLYRKLTKRAHSCHVCNVMAGLCVPYLTTAFTVDESGGVLWSNLTVRDAVLQTRRTGRVPTLIGKAAMNTKCPASSKYTVSSVRRNPLNGVGELINGSKTFGPNIALNKSFSFFC